MNCGSHRTIFPASVCAVVLALCALSMPSSFGQTQNPEIVTAISGAPDPSMIVAERRVALVIGNGAYKYSPLKNPVNDAKSIAQKLSSLGFEVDVRVDQTRDQMGRALREFGNRLNSPNAVGVFYFAGHGAQSKGRNVLVPVDADIQSEEEILFQGVDLNQVFDRMESARNAVNLVILDACRNNPFARSFRSVAAGLSAVDAPSGTFIAFATAPGGVARDGTGENGVYTKHILANLDQPGQPIESIFKKVRVGVRAETENQQTPWDNSSLTADFYFRARLAGDRNQGDDANMTREDILWSSAEESGGIFDYVTYLRA